MNDYEYLTHERLRAERKRHRRRKARLKRLAWGLLAAVATGAAIAVASILAEPREALAASQTEPQAAVRTITIVMVAESIGVPKETALAVAEAVRTAGKAAQTGPDRECLGTFTLTAYCNCSECCGKWAGGPTKSGTMPQAGRTIAVDPRVIPIGSRVYIDGLGEYIAEDTGSAIRGNRIDVYMATHEAARWFADGAGSCSRRVWILSE